MDFGWLRKLLKKNNSNNTTSNLATIDTSFIRVPKLSKLSKKDQEKVLDFYNKLVSGCDEDLVKYSNDLLERANNERELLVRTMTRYDEQYNELKKEYKKNQQVLSVGIYNLGKLSNLEYINIVNNILEIRNELVLKLVALDMYIKKEEKRKYDFLGIFGKAEKIKYFTDKNKLLCERERLLTSIKIDDNILTAVRRDISNNQILELYHTLFDKLNNSNDSQLRDFLKNSMSRLSKKSVFSVLDNYQTEIVNEVLLKMKDYPIREEGYNCSYFWFGDLFGPPIDIDDSLINYILNSIKENREYYSWEDLLLVVPDEFLDKLYEIVAKYSRQRDLYVFEHRNDCKRYLKEEEELVKKFESASFDDWDTNLLKDKIKHLTHKLNNSLQLHGNARIIESRESYDDQIGPSVEKQIKKNYFKLLFFYFLKNGIDSDILSLYEFNNYDFLRQSIYWTMYCEFYDIYEELRVDFYNKYKVMPKNKIRHVDDYIDYSSLIRYQINEVLEEGRSLYKLLEGTYEELSNNYPQIAKTKVLTK